jgi:carboxypeptidase PM20D1
MKKIVLSILILVTILLGVLLIRTFTLPSQQPAGEPLPDLKLDLDQIGNHLAGALCIPTVSHQDSTANDYSQLNQLHRYISETYPRLNTALKKQTINRYSLLYTWEGRDTSLAPVLLMAHLDVVPVDSNALNQWQMNPFEGMIDEGYVWGRGALDDKGSVISILEAVEGLLTAGYQPQRTLLIALGHDEEVGGQEGARHVANYLRARGIRPAFILDEGGAIVIDVMPGISQPIAFVAIGEKGSVSVELTVLGTGGHSSMPPEHTAIGVLSTAIQRLEANPLPAVITTPVHEMLLTLAPAMSFPRRVVMANLWLFSRAVKKLMAASPNSNALLRTTTAVTMFNGGVKENVLPPVARAVVNFRLRPGEQIADVLRHVETVIDDPRITVTVLNDSFLREASAISDPSSPSYQLVAKTIHRVFPDVLVAPGLSVGGTDTKHYADLTNNIYRFIPFPLTNKDLKRIHGTNERVSLRDLAKAVAFYIYMIKEATAQ